MGGDNLNLFLATDPTTGIYRLHSLELILPDGLAQFSLYNAKLPSLAIYTYLHVSRKR